MLEVNDRTLEEIWKPIPGYETLYEVSNLGRVRSLCRYKKICKKRTVNARQVDIQKVHKGGMTYC